MILALVVGFSTKGIIVGVCRIGVWWRIVGWVYWPFLLEWGDVVVEVWWRTSSIIIIRRVGRSCMRTTRSAIDVVIIVGMIIVIKVRYRVVGWFISNIHLGSSWSCSPRPLRKTGSIISNLWTSIRRWSTSPSWGRKQFRGFIISIGPGGCWEWHVRASILGRQGSG